MKENIDFMAEFLKIVLEALRKQAFSVMILISCCLALIWFSMQQRDEMTERIRETENKCHAQIDILSDRLDRCADARHELSVEVAVLRLEVNALNGIKKRRQ